jgi:hypothetical protein
MGRPVADVSVEELRLAWQRTRADHAERRFTDHPHLIDWVETDPDPFLSDLAEEIRSGYTPQPATRCWYPKPRGLMRPGSLLCTEDEVVFNFLLGRCLAGLRTQLLAYQGEPDAAYLLADRADDPRWLKSSYVSWKGFRNRSKQKLDDGFAYMLSADITAFYDNIDLRTLSSDVRNATGLVAEAVLLNDCLDVWAGPRRKGIPQGYSASDLLAKLYLNSIDLSLVHAGHAHLRYVDDYRVFVRSRRDGRIAILTLIESLHNRGLSVQSAKTRIWNATEARAQVDGVAPVIEGIADTLREEIAEAADLNPDYVPAWEVNKWLESREGPPPEILERAFQEHFQSVDGEEFDKSLFHYLLGRLRKTGSAVAVDYCVQALRALPEETQYVLDYLAESGSAAGVLSRVLDYMYSLECIYDFQLYQLIRWFYRNGFQDGRMVDFARNQTFDRNRPVWLRSYAVAYLGRYGDRTDFERLEAEYGTCGTPLERADVVAGLQKMEITRRNALYGRAEAEGGLVKRAVVLAKRET